jgi:hypothetical protein
VAQAHAELLFPANSSKQIKYRPNKTKTMPRFPAAWKEKNIALPHIICAVAHSLVAPPPPFHEHVDLIREKTRGRVGIHVLAICWLGRWPEEGPISL